MNPRPSALLVLTLPFLAALPTVARAVPIVADFDGFIYFVADPATGVALNDPVHGRIRYDSDSPPNPDSEQQAVYDGLQELSITILHDGAALYEFTATGGITVVVSSPTNYSFLAYGGSGLQDDTLLGQPLETLALILQNDQPVPGKTTALPLELSLDPFNPALSFFDVDVNDNSVLSAYLTSLRTVPEPGTLLLALIASPSMILVYWRRRFVRSAIRP
jgi:hypothetical protein